MKKLTKPQLKKILPKQLYVNLKKGKRGASEPKVPVNVRLEGSTHKELTEILKTLGITQANFLRYSIELGLADIAEKIKVYSDKAEKE